MSLTQEAPKTPVEIIEEYAANAKAFPDSYYWDPHVGIAHTFMEWKWRMVSGKAITDYQGEAAIDKDRRLFRLFCHELEENGVTLSEDLQEEAFQGYLDD